MKEPDSGSRDQILRALRAATTQRRGHPGAYSPQRGASGTPPGAGKPSRSWKQFSLAASGVGSHVLGPLSRDAAASAAREHLAELGSGRCVAEASAAELLGAGPWRVASGAPHDFADVSLAIVHGAFGVCENGAVLLPASLAPHRSLWVLCEHLLLLIHVADLVLDMHEAVERLTGPGLSAPHTVFVAGPSKTADIEQALVEGAHGPRSLWILGVR